MTTRSSYPTYPHTPAGDADFWGLTARQKQRYITRVHEHRDRMLHQWHLTVSAAEKYAGLLHAAGWILAVLVLTGIFALAYQVVIGW